MTPILAIAIWSAVAMPPLSVHDVQSGSAAAALQTCDPAPILELPATRGSSDTFAVMLTGDGGWRPVDRGVTDVLRANGIPVVGYLVPQYFRKLRTADESACALADVIRTYKQRWQKDKVMLVGFSRGADVLPFMVNRLPGDVRSSVVRIALLGLEPWIDFRYNPWWTLAHYFRHEAQFAVLPEVERLGGQNVVCVYGEREKDTLCDHLDAAHFEIVREPGGHHFGGHYAEVADRILHAQP